RAFDSALDLAAQALHQGAFGRVERGHSPQTTRAGTKSLAQGVRRGGEEGDVARRGAARGATGPAKNAGGADGKNEPAVKGRVAGGHGAPPGARRSAVPRG